MLKKIITFFLVVFVFSCSNTEKNTYIEAKVNKIVSSITLETQNHDEKIKEVSFELINSNNETFLVKQKFYPFSKSLKEPVEGDRVVLSDIISPEGELNLQIIDYKRNNIVYFSIILLLITMFLWGKAKSVFFIFIMISILILYKMIYEFSIFNTLFSSFIFCLLTSFAINFLMYKKKKIAFKLIISNLFGIIFTIFVSYIYSNYSYFDSLIFTDNSIIVDININSVIVSSILISSLGIIIYSSISSFNNYNELLKAFPEKKDREIKKLALRNIKPTLFLNILKIYLIYIGLSLPVIIKNNYNNILNIDLIVFYIISFSIISISSIISANSIIYLNKSTKKNPKLNKN